MGVLAGSNRDDDLADLLARLDEAMGVGDLVEGEGSRDRGAKRPSKCACRDHLASILGMAVGRFRTDSGHPHYGDAQGDLRSCA